MNFWKADKSITYRLAKHQKELYSNNIAKEH
jgi:hypothetical protein